MFIRRPIPRSGRVPARRPQRVPASDSVRPLLRLFIRNSWSQSQREGYILEVREGPAVNGNTNAASEKLFPQPWIVVTDVNDKQNTIGLPVSVCDTLLKHLMTCAESNGDASSDGSEEAETPNTTDAKITSQDPRDSNSLEECLDGAERSKVSSSTGRRTEFNLAILGSLRIVCEATGCKIEVSSKDPNGRRQAGSTDDQDQVRTSQAKRWIFSTPSRNCSEVNGSKVTSESDTGAVETQVVRSKQKPWECNGVIELYGNLMSQFCIFLADVATRYRVLNAFPEVPSLYSTSGGRRFYFDLRETPWGKRLHISQVTDQHRNVIGVPLEELVTFRDRLDSLIQELNLDDQHTLRSKISTRSSAPLSYGRRTAPRPRSVVNGQMSGPEQQSGHDPKRQRRRFVRPRRVIINEQRDGGKGKTVESDEQGETSGRTTGGLQYRRQDVRSGRANRNRRHPNHNQLKEGEIQAEGSEKSGLEQVAHSAPITVPTMTAEANA